MLVASISFSQDDTDGRAAPHLSKTFLNVTPLHYYWTGFAQFLCLLFIFLALGWHMFLPFWLFHCCQQLPGFTVPLIVVIIFAAVALIQPVILLIVVVFKWILVGRIRPGAYTLWGWFALRFWAVQTMFRLAKNIVGNTAFKLFGPIYFSCVSIRLHCCVLF